MNPIRHGIAALLPPAAKKLLAARIDAGDHRDQTGMGAEAMFGDVGLCRADLRQAEPVFRHTPRAAASEPATEDERLRQVLRLAQDLRVMHRIEVIYG